MAKLPLRFILLATALLPTAWAQNYPELTGYNRLLMRRGGVVPRGNTVVVGLVEPAENGTGGYVPDFSSSEFTGYTFDLRSGSSIASVHATDVGGLFFGKTFSFSPGANRVRLYRADSPTGFLLSPETLDLTNPAGPHSPQVQVLSNSWVLNAETTIATLLARRIDWMAEAFNVVVVGGLPNEAATPIPALASSTYNSIIVGLSSGLGSHGRTTFAESGFDSVGRIKPDIVVPFDVSSACTPLVASAATYLVDLANLSVMGGDTRFTDAAKPIVIKSVLQAGAEKFPGWTKGKAGDATDDLESPLDLRYGAGELDIDRSDQMFALGRQPEGQVYRIGWTYEAALAPGETKLYYFFLDEAGQHRFASSLNWHRQVYNSGQTSSLDSVRLPRLELELFSFTAADGFTLLEASRSPRDNLQHVYQPTMTAGIYVLRVLNTGTYSTPFALSWGAFPVTN